MIYFKTYGNSPYRIVLVHGGPGALGSLEPLALELSKEHGIIEALQTRTSIMGLLDELLEIVKQNTEGPIILVGHSWGAWLSLIFTSEYPELIEKLILIGAGSFDESYSKEISETRMDRLSRFDQHLFDRLLLQLNNPKNKNKDVTFKRLSKIIQKADSHKLINTSNDRTVCRFDLFKSIWPEANQMRKSGELLKDVHKIKCPVIAIHGDYDPHLWEGVHNPLKQLLDDFQFHLLEKCGHEPWNEECAREQFFQIINQYICR
ncbi:MAG: alpha/beta hydrolase [Bacteroidales bacterium]|nr:alpha/beta hydrolase [Bacteroidales bacterium]